LASLLLKSTTYLLAREEKMKLMLLHYDRNHCGHCRITAKRVVILSMAGQDLIGIDVFLCESSMGGELISKKVACRFDKQQCRFDAADRHSAPSGQRVHDFITWWLYR
jgi:hypothetical protein